MLFLDRVIQILSRRTKNNPVLIGEPGVGKTAIAEGLALRIAAGNVPMRLQNKEIHLLDMTALVAGTQFRGQFESRIKGLIDEVKADGNVILFIDEVHSLVGAGESELSLVYARPWEDEKPAKTFKMKVVVDAASPREAVNDAANEFKLKEKDNGKTIEVHTGDIIRITLESNITTGYDWENADKVDKDILKLDRNDYVSDPNPEELDGVGGKTVIVYRALKQGKAKIDLSYMQAWEPDADDIEKGKPDGIEKEPCIVLSYQLFPKYYNP